VNTSFLPTSPPNTRLPQTGQELRTASPPLADLDANCRVGPLNRMLLLANPMQGTNPEPDAFWQSAQQQSPANSGTPSAS
jgi:hypothetical protein